jgi:hypothetical protein
MCFNFGAFRPQHAHVRRKLEAAGTVTLAVVAPFPPGALRVRRALAAAVALRGLRAGTDRFCAPGVNETRRRPGASRRWRRRRCGLWSRLRSGNWCGRDGRRPRRRNWCGGGGRRLWRRRCGRSRCRQCWCWRSWSRRYWSRPNRAVPNIHVLGARHAFHAACPDAALLIIARQRGWLGVATCRLPGWCSHRRQLRSRHGNERPLCISCHEKGYQHEGVFPHPSSVATGNVECQCRTTLRTSRVNYVSSEATPTPLHLRPLS